MKRLLCIIAVASAAICGFDAQAQNATEELKDKLYVNIMQSYNVRDWQSIIDYSQQLLNAGASLEELEITYAEALSETGQGQKAVQRLEQYLKQYDDDFQGYQVLGDIYAKQGNQAEAARAYQKSADTNPNYARPYVSMARMYGTSDPEKSVDSYCKAMRIFLLAQQPQGAIQLGTEAMAISDKNPNLMMLIGDALCAANMEDKALPFYAETIALAGGQANPDMEMVIEANYNIALIFYKQHQYERSLGFLRGMLDSEDIMNSDKTDFATILCLAAADKLRLGDPVSAQAYLERAKGCDEVGYEKLYQSLLSLTE